MWVTIKTERLGGTQIPHSVGGEIRYNSCLFGSFWLVMNPTLMLGIWHEGDWMKWDLAHPISGQVKRWSPISSWVLNLVMNSSFLWYLVWNVLVIVWIYLLLYPLYLCSYNASYKHVFDQWWCMALSMFLLVNECIMYLWSNRLYCS